MYMQARTYTYAKPWIGGLYTRFSYAIFAVSDLSEIAGHVLEYCGISRDLFRYLFVNFQQIPLPIFSTKAR